MINHPPLAARLSRLVFGVICALVAVCIYAHGFEQGRQERAPARRDPPTCRLEVRGRHWLDRTRNVGKVIQCRGGCTVKGDDGSDYDVDTLTVVATP